MPAFWQACLMMACVFCRGALVEVWNTYFSFLPSFSRMPSAPLVQPASSRILLALSMSNAYFSLGDLNRLGALTKLAVATAPRP